MLLLKEKLEQSELQPNDITFNTMIDACMKAGNMKLSFDLFEEMQLKYGITPDIFTYSSLIKGIKSPENINAENNLKKILSLLEQIKENELVKGDEILYNCVIDACFKFGDYYQALQVYHDMLSFDIKPSAVTYGIMIKGYGQFKKLEKVLELYEKMICENLKLNEITLGCLVDACVKCGNLKKALEIVEKEKSVPINTIIFTTILKGFTRERNFDKALEMFNIMKSNPQIKPNIITYNSLLDCAVQSGQFKNMHEIFMEIMKYSDSECSADIITFSTYLKGLCRAKEIEKAYQLFLNLRNEKKFKIDEVMYNSLLDGLIKAHDHEKCSQVYIYMKEDNIKASNVTYSILIKLFSNQGMVDKALDILQQMKNENLKPGLIVYTCLIQTCIKYKRIELIMKLYQEFISNNIRGDVVFYNTLISGLVFNYDLKNACEIMMTTLEKNLILNHEVYNNLLRNLIISLTKKNYTNLENKECEISLLKIAQTMRKNGIDIEEKLYSQITAFLYNDNLGFQSHSWRKNEERRGYHHGFERKKSDEEKKGDFFNRAVKH